jgi:hypothetical protein
MCWSLVIRQVPSGKFKSAFVRIWFFAISFNIVIIAFYHWRPAPEGSTPIDLCEGRYMFDQVWFPRVKKQFSSRPRGWRRGWMTVQQCSKQNTRHTVENKKGPFSFGLSTMLRVLPYFLISRGGQANLFFKSANRKSAHFWAHSAIANSQISWVCQSAKRKFENFYD